MSSAITSPQDHMTIDHAVPPPMPVPLLRTARAIIFLLLILSPLLFLPDVVLANAFDTPRRLLLLLGAGLLAALLLHSWAQRERVFMRRHALDLPVILFALAAIITGLTSAYPWIVFWGPVWSKDGLQVVGTGIILYFAVKEFLREPGDLLRALAAMVCTGGCVALIGIVEYLGLINFHLPLSGYRLIGTMGNSLFTGLYLATLIPLALGGAVLATSARLRLALTASGVVMAPALVFTHSRAAWLGFAVSLLLMTLLSIRPLRRLREDLPRLRWVVATVVLALGLTAGIWMAHARWTPERHISGARVQSLATMKRDASVRDRTTLVLGGLRMFLARPVQGWGIGVSRFVMPAYRPAGGDRGYIQATPHSVPLQVAAEMGVLGLAPFLLLLLVLFRDSFRAARRPDRLAWLGVGLFGAFAANVITTLFGLDNAATLSLFWVCAGLLAAMTAQDRPLSLRPATAPAPTSSARRVVFKTLGTLLVALVSVAVLMQLFAAYYLFKGASGIARMQQLAETDRKHAGEYGIIVSADLLRSINLTPMPSLTRKGFIQRGDSLSWQVLAKVHQTQSRVYPDPINILGAHHLMVGAADRTLQLLDRDSLRGELIIEHLRFGELRDARRHMDALLAFSPQCSETHLLNAQLLEAEGRPTEATRAAAYTVHLDPAFARARLFLAHLQSAEALRSTITQQALAHQAIATFAVAAEQDEPFSARDLAEYAAMLFLTGEWAQAAEQAQTLRGKPEFAALCEQLRAVSRQRAYAATGAKFFAALTGDTP